MAHFAKIKNNKVIQVIKENDDFLESLPTPNNWLKTSYNTHGGKYYDPNTNKINTKKPFRKNYAKIGYTYDKELDAFIPPQTFPSWVLNDDSCLWQPPIPLPDDGKEYIWNEQEKKWTYTDTIQTSKAN